MTLMSSPLGAVWWQWLWPGCGVEPQSDMIVEMNLQSANGDSWKSTEAGLTGTLVDDWNRSTMWWRLKFLQLLTGGLCPLWRVGTGGELVFSVQGAGGRWREWRRVGARETGGGTEEWTLPQEESLPLTVRRWEERRKISFHVLGFEHNASLRWSSPDCVAAVVGGVCHPSNKELLWGSIWLHPPWGMSFPRFTHFCFKTAEQEWSTVKCWLPFLFSGVNAGHLTVVLTAGLRAVDTFVSTVAQWTHNKSGLGVRLTWTSW